MSANKNNTNIKSSILSSQIIKKKEAKENAARICGNVSARVFPLKVACVKLRVIYCG